MDSWLQQKLADLHHLHGLKSLKEDVVDWLNKTLGVGITAETFLGDLETGVHLCRLAARVHTAAQESDNEVHHIPEFKPRYYSQAKPGTFYARDNSANFIKWCRNLGVKDGCIFESEDLVSHRCEKSVILCLLEVSRIVWKFGIEPPDIIKIQRQIEDTEQRKNGKMWNAECIEELLTNFSQLKLGDCPDDVTFSKYPRGSVETIPETPSYKLLIDILDNPQADANDTLDGENADRNVNDTAKSVDEQRENEHQKLAQECESTEETELKKMAIVTPRKRCLSYDEHGRRTPGGPRTPSASKPRTPHCKKSVVIDLDDEVVRISVACRCETYVEKVKAGKYRIFEKEVLVRVLGERNIMVRVGGGWQTLEQYFIYQRKKWLQQDVVSSVASCTKQRLRIGSTKGH